MRQPSVSVLVDLTRSVRRGVAGLRMKTAARVGVRVLASETRATFVGLLAKSTTTGVIWGWIGRVS